MTIIPIKLPPGVYRNGTQYGAAGRWYECNLVRWHDDALRPVGGWEARQTAAGDDVILAAGGLPGDEVARDALAYTDNGGVPLSVYGTNKRLFALPENNLVADITPAGFTGGLSEPTVNVGFGRGFYGTGAYGVPRDAGSRAPDPVWRWQFDTWGEDVIAAGVGDGPMYTYTPGDPAAVVLANAPEDVIDFVTTDQRIVMTIRNETGTDTRIVQWSDREDNTSWTPTISNYAGSFRLQGTGNPVGMYKVLGQVLILTETDAHVARYLGAPLVYGFERVGTSCAPVAAQAVVKTDRFAMWLGARNFWMFDGTLRVINSDLMDHIVETMDPAYVSKIHACTIAEYNEIWWFYQSKTGDEIDSYVAFDYNEGHWIYGSLNRTVAFDAGVYPRPLMADASGAIYQHENVNIKVEGEAFAISGPLEMANGTRNLAVQQILPDTERADTVEITLYGKSMPTATEYTYGPYAYANPISTTGAMGREIRMGVRGLTNDWEVGTMRFNIAKLGGGMR